MSRNAQRQERIDSIKMAGFEVVTVLLLSVVMFIASFAAGTVPLAMSLSQERMNLVGSLGVGLLVGTSLGVVLPEGIEMLYSSTSQGSSHGERENHLAMALALITGYLIMHLFTYLPPLILSKHEHSSIPMSSLPSSPRLERAVSNPTSVEPAKSLSNTTVGLCIHALADGIALGSSAVSNNLALEGIVFFAIMLHKVHLLLKLAKVQAPASFSLTTILLRESYPRHSTKRQLLLFALSSPISTIVTYFTLSSFGNGGSDISFWSGVFLLFSAGTLIFASTNVHLHGEEEEKPNAQRDGIKELFAGAVGMCIPLILGSLGHGH